MARILVLGWYGNGNIGDELMADGLRSLLPAHELRFVSHIDRSSLERVDIVMVGGGSFLDSPPSVASDAWGRLLSVPVVHVGVGAETNVHPQHAELLRRSRAIFVRSAPSAEFQSVRSDIVVIPDLSFALPPLRAPRSRSIGKRALVLPNAELLPTTMSPSWMGFAWDYFRSELCQAIDQMMSGGWTVSFAPMCDAPRTRDSWACASLASFCSRRAETIVNQPGSTVDELSGSDLVVTQRFHGALLCRTAGVPCIVVHHHSKLAGADQAIVLDYYGFRKDLFLSAVERRFKPGPPPDRTSFFPLVERINGLVGASR